MWTKKTLVENGLLEKCVASEFGGLQRKEDGNDVSSHLKKDKPTLV